MSLRKRTRKRKRSNEVVRPPRPTGPVADLRVGDSVVVKPGVRDPDFDIDIGGWQGRVVETPNAEGLVLIAWDSITLRQMPDILIVQCEEEGLDWTRTNLLMEEVEPTAARDSWGDVEGARQEMKRKHTWSFLGEEGLRINQILADVNPDDDMAVMHAWERYLNKHLDFPFEAEVAEFQERGPLQAGDRLRVLRFADASDVYGVIVSVQSKHGRHFFPLCDLEAVDEDSPNYQPLRDYRLWFANR